MPNNSSFQGLIRELLIVVFGILIAFSLNNFAQNLKDRKTSQNYIDGLVIDLEQDLELMHNIRDSLAILQKKAMSFIPHTYNPNIPGREEVVLQAFSQLTQAPTFTSNQTTFETLLNSGDLKYIKDFELRSQIVGFYKQYERLEEENYRARVFIQETVIPYYMNHIDFTKIYQQQTEAYWEDPRFRNIIYSYAGIYRIPLEKYDVAIERCQALIEALESY